ncbi:unnamed protein product [Spirodela intermedia]|uniref:Uncharacterized protein n=1 Tax=Spirodela intermedia TaxID=51605 RepID=A0A7I8L4Q4_SPIIN|nr:unnamed protein product [Spirodela intermedia]
MIHRKKHDMFINYRGIQILRRRKQIKRSRTCQRRKPHGM